MIKKTSKSFNSNFLERIKNIFHKISLFFYKKRNFSNNNNNKSGIVISIDELISSRTKSKNILIKPTKNVGSHASGSYRSPFRGRGMEFDEVRLYQEGDDVRCIDWRVTAKTGKAHTKLFHEEKERPVLILADLRPPMRFATRVAFKSVIAAKTSSVIGWSALENGDRIGGMVISAAKTTMLKPHRSRKRLMGFLHALSEASMDNSNKTGTSLSKSLSELKKVALSGSMVFVISDFSDYNEEVEKQLLYLKAHSDVICIKIYDVLEKEPPPHGVYRISDGKNIALMRADDEKWRKAYIQLFEEKEQRIKHFCNKYRISFISIRTDEDIFNSIYSGLYTQKRRSASIMSNKKSAVS